jgi:hypothetical protein
MKRVLIAVLAFSLLGATASFGATKPASSHSKSKNKRSKGQKGFAKSKHKGHAKPMAKSKRSK